MALLAMAGLPGCADISQKFAATASQMPYIGLSPEAPARPEVQGAYPAVHDMPAQRNGVTLTDIEQQRLEDDLTVARDRQQASVGLPPADPKKAEANRAADVKKANARKSVKVIKLPPHVIPASNMPTASAPSSAESIY